MNRYFYIISFVFVYMQISDVKSEEARIFAKTDVVLNQTIKPNLQGNSSPSSKYGSQIETNEHQLFVSNSISFGKRSIYIYQINEGNLLLKQTLQSPHTAPFNDNFADNLAVSNEWVFVYARFGRTDGVNSPGSGVIYIYQINKGIWLLHQILELDNSEGFLSGGMNVDGNKAFIGVNRTEDGIRRGQINYYKLVGENWVLASVIESDLTSERNFFGYEMVVDNAITLLVGSATENKVYVYTQNQDEWQRQEDIVNPVEGFYFGGQIAQHEDVMVIGSLKYLSFYSKLNGQWLYEHSVLKPAPAQVDTYKILLTEDNLFLSCRRCESNGVPYTGKVYLYEKSTPQWGLLGELVPVTMEPYLQLGNALAANGAHVWFGAKDSHRQFEKSGAMFHFENQNKQWKYIQSFDEGESNSKNKFGRMLDLENSYAIVGSINNPFFNGVQGTVNLYKNTGNKWEFLDKYIESDDENGLFNIAVQLNGNRAYATVNGQVLEYDISQDKLTVFDVIQTPSGCRLCALRSEGNHLFVGDDYTSSGGGVVYIYEYNDTQWHLKQTLSTEGGDILFGASLAIENDFMAVGAPRDYGVGRESGAVFIYQNIKNSWEFKQKLYPSDGSEYLNFGWSLEINDNKLIVGAPGDNPKTENEGAYLFENLNGDWVETDKFEANESHTSIGFGTSVSIDGSALAIGATFGESGAVDSGVTYFYELIDGVWQNTKMILPNEGDHYDKFGSSLIIEEGQMLIGAEDGDGSGSDSGIVYYYDFRDLVFKDGFNL